MLVPIMLYTYVEKSDVRNKVLSNSNLKRKNQDLVLNLTHMLMCAEDDSLKKKGKKKRKRLPQGSKVIIFA